MASHSTSCTILLIAFFALTCFSGFSQSASGYYVSEVISFDTGYVKGNTGYDPERFNPQKALGAPKVDRFGFVSLGFGGEIVLKFSAPVKNGEGVDLIVHEVSWGDPSCATWPEKAEIFVSPDNINWIPLGVSCRSANISLPAELDWVLYIKIKDVTDPDFFSLGDDGYDVTSVESVHGWLGPVIPTFDCINKNADGTYTAFLGYENRDSKLTFNISKGVRNHFSTTTDLGQPEEFLPGVHAKDFFSDFDGNPVTWTLIGPDSIARTVQFSSASPECPVTLPTAEMSGNTVLCGSEEASVTIILTGTAPWTIVYENSAQQQTTVSGIASSPYSFSTKENTTYSLVSVSDVNGVGAVLGNATIAVYERPSAVISGGGVFCDVPSPVNISLSGNAPWSFSLVRNGEVFQNVIDWQASEYQFNVSSAGEYGFVNLKDQYCSSTSAASVDVTFNTKPTAVISGGGIICEDNGSVMVNINLSGVAPFSVAYSDGTNQHSLSDINETAIPLVADKATQYQLVSVSDAHCTGVVLGMAVVSDLRIPINLTAEAEVCFGENVVLNSGLSATNFPFEWTTSGNGSFNNLQSLNPTYVPGDGETGDIMFTLSIENDCGKVSKSVTTRIMEAIDPDFTFPPKVEAHNPVAFTPVQTGADSYLWVISGGNETEGEILEHTFTSAGEYQVTLTVIKQGCEQSAVKTISVDDTKKVLYVPNVFSPWASNPENQVVKVYGSGISAEGFIFRILNRWGNILFETTVLSVAQNSGWNGTARGTGEMQALGVYTYMLKGKFLDGEIFDRTGSVSLVK